MRATRAVAVTCSALLIVACGTSSRKEQSKRPAQQVANTVATLQRDLSNRNWADICERVFSSQARAQAGGESCQTFVRRGAAGLRRGRIEVRSIEVVGQKASADVVSSADGQARVAQTIEFVFENGSYRISQLAP
jgi:hypothetical protein